MKEKEMKIENVTAVYREALKNGGFRFTDQDGNVLRKKATRPYKYMAVSYWTNGKKFASFHSTANPSKTHQTLTIERVIVIQER